ncbi:hypothetical protein [Streptomyces sp. NPDC051214]
MKAPSLRSHLLQERRQFGDLHSETRHFTIECRYLRLVHQVPPFVALI